MNGISAVIPSLNAASGLGRAIECLEDSQVAEIIVSDGGSTDATVALAEERATVVIIGPPGRGGQLRRGAEAAHGDWLLFLHADTVLSPSWRAEVRNFISIPSNRNRAGVFRLRLESDAPQARRVERLANWRTHKLGLPYGDQGLLISRDLYNRLGGFDDIPLMEDVALARRIGKARIHRFDATAMTSADRYERDGWLARPLRNLGCLTLYFLGLPPARIARMYDR